MLPLGRTRCYLIGHALLVDTGWAGTMPLLHQALSPAGMVPSDISCLVVTHFHPDHMGLAPALMDLGCTFLVPDIQLSHLHDADRIFATERRQHGFHPIDDQAVCSFPREDARRILSSYGIAGEILATPGHSEDSVTLLLDSGDAFVGDLPRPEMAGLYADPILAASWEMLLSRGARCIHFAHEEDEWL